jgi:hypothetical protein
MAAEFEVIGTTWDPPPFLAYDNGKAKTTIVGDREPQEVEI